MHHSPLSSNITDLTLDWKFHIAFTNPFMWNQSAIGLLKYFVPHDQQEVHFDMFPCFISQQNLWRVSTLATSTTTTTRSSAVSQSWPSAQRETTPVTMRLRCSGGEISKYSPFKLEGHSASGFTFLPMKVIKYSHGFPVWNKGKCENQQTLWSSRSLTPLYTNSHHEEKPIDWIKWQDIL